MRKHGWALLSIISIILISPVPSAMAQSDEVESLRTTVKAVLPETPLSEKSSAWKAVERLSEIGDTHAIGVLQDTLTTYGANRRLKRRALLALARIGSPESVTAIAQFEGWTIRTRLKPPAFRLGPRALPMDHFGSIDVKPLARCTDGDGTQWAVFLWHRFGGRRLWITSSPGNDQWSAPVWLNVDWTPKIKDDSHAELRTEGGRFVLTVEGQEFTFRVEDYTHDQDHDGLPDQLEELLGTNPKKADTDQDTLADGKDGNPLTAASDSTDSLSQIRQAAFSYIFDTSDSLDAIVVVQNGDFAYQEYRGYSGIVLRSPKVRKGFFNLTRMSARKDTPTTASAIVEDWEGDLAGSGRTLKLAKVHGKWVVVDEGMAWVASLLRNHCSPAHAG